MVQQEYSISFAVALAIRFPAFALHTAMTKYINGPQAQTPASSKSITANGNNGAAKPKSVRRTRARKRRHDPKFSTLVIRAEIQPKRQPAFLRLSVIIFQ